MSEKTLRPRVPMITQVNKFKVEYEPHIRDDVKKHFNDFRTMSDIYNYLFVMYFDSLWE